jgi:hypothetical protein
MTVWVNASDVELLKAYEEYVKADASFHMKLETNRRARVYWSISGTFLVVAAKIAEAMGDIHPHWDEVTLIGLTTFICVAFFTKEDEYLRPKLSTARCNFEKLRFARVVLGVYGICCNKLPLDESQHVDNLSRPWLDNRYAENIKHKDLLEYRKETIYL